MSSTRTIVFYFLSRIFLLTALFVIMMPAPLRLMAQDSATGAIRGTVLDATGGRIAQASIVVVNTATNARYEAISDGEGRFAIDGLRPGDYSARTVARGQPSRGELKSGIADQESRENPAQRLIAETVFTADVQAGD